jgi:hypothetical protein
MDEDELLAIVNGEIDRARDYCVGVIGKERATAYDYYYGRKFGNEQEGRSQVISHDVAQQIDSAVPQLIKFFAGSDKSVEFTARQAEDMVPAEQATELVNYTFYTQNNGFLLLHDVIKNALLQKTGCFKWYWDTSVKVEEETYYQQTQDMVLMLAQDPTIDVVGYSPETVDTPAGPLELYNVQIRKKSGKGKVKVDVIPPDELLIADNAAGLEADEIPCITHETEKTLSQLIQMGYDRATVEGLPSDGNYLSYERQSRDERTGTYTQQHEIPDPMMKKVMYRETYILVDFDKDGIAERRKVCSVGGTLLHNEVVASVPMSFGTCKIMPHEFFGVSMADEVMDLQLLKSTLWRQSMDNIYLSNTPRLTVDTTRVTNLDDVMTVRMGGVIRSAGDATGAVQPVTVPFVAGNAFQMIEYVDAEEETRTGVSRLMQGIDPNTLNKTATGVNALMNAAQARLELVARGLAETLIKPMMRGVFGLWSKHQEEAKEITIRLRNQYVPIDPRVWETDYDMTVNVGLGTGTKDQQMAHLTNLMGIQSQIFASPFAQGFQPGQIYSCLYNTASKLAELAGFKDADKYFPNPDNFQPPQPPPPPESIQVQQMKGQQAIEQEQVKAQTEMSKQAAQSQSKGQEIQMQAWLKQMEVMLAGQLEQFKAELAASVDLRVGLASAQAQASRPVQGPPQ